MSMTIHSVLQIGRALRNAVTSHFKNSAEVKIESQDMYFARGKFGELPKWKQITPQPNNLWIAKSAVPQVKG